MTYEGDTQSTRAAVERYIGALVERDIDEVRACFAEDATWYLPSVLPMSGTYEGRDTIVDDFLGRALELYDPASIRLEVSELVAEGDRAVLAWTSHARVARTGEPYQNECIAMIVVAHGVIASVREYMDTLYAYDKLVGAEVGSR